MKPKSIGIVSGAGPMAGAVLLEKIIQFSGKIYGCRKDRDFPEILLLSFPFAEMLDQTADASQLERELQICLSRLRSNGASILAIACNTLHAFLKDPENAKDLIRLPQAAAEEIRKSKRPLVLCTSTSVKCDLYGKFFPCVYPNAPTQFQIDRLINRILCMEEKREILAHNLTALLEAQTADTIVLGCTELSLLKDLLLLKTKRIIDPLEILARKIVKRSFFSRKSPGMWKEAVQ